jgi:hypothetical protein
LPVVSLGHRQRSNQAVDNLADFVRTLQNSAQDVFVHESKSVRNDELGFDFRQRPRRGAQEPPEFLWQFASLSFCDVAGHGNGRATQLSGQSIQFFSRERPGNAVNKQDQFDSFLPSD